MMAPMTAEEKIQAADLDSLAILQYPDPRLSEVCTPIKAVDDRVAALVETMVELMFHAQGVGLAAPQVGVTVQLFLATPTFDRDDVHVYINPRIVSGEGGVDDEEGCLSFPGVYSRVKRKKKVTIEATGLDGELFRETVTGLHSRILQHENDHLEGILLVDRMGTISKLSNRKALSNLREAFEEEA